MTPPDSSDAVSAEQSSAPLSFDQADVPQGGGGMTCSNCAQSIAGSYFEVGASLLCAWCKDKVQSELNAGSGVARFGRAFLFGAVGGLAGAIVYYGVSAITGYNLGLISVAV